jgi:transcriptional regulator with XRE-family HTH domain
MRKYLYEEVWLMITEKVGNRIKEIRKEKGISQEKLALKAELDRTYIAGVESGKRNLSIKSLEKILNALEVSFENFFKNM